MSPIFAGNPTGSGGGGGTGLSAWVTKTAAYTVVNGDRILADTSAGTWVLSCPLIPTAGFEFWVRDAKGSWQTNNLTINRNGKPVRGSAENVLGDHNWQELHFVYKDTITGWLVW